MRILHLVHRSWPFHGGAERYVLEHALAGNKRGHKSVICTTDAWDMSWLVSKRGDHIIRKKDVWNGIEIRRFPVKHPPLQDILRGILRRISKCGRDRYFYPNPFIPSLHKWLAGANGFDFVHANAMPFLLYEGWNYCVRTGTGLVSVPHASVGERYRSISALHYLSGCQKKILRQSSFTVAQSGFERHIFMDAGVPGERILQLGSGVDPSEFSNADPSAGLERFGLEGPVVLSLTAHSEDRGSRHIVEACRYLLKKGRKFTLVLAGPILPDMETFLDSVKEPEESGWDSIVTTGYVGKKERIDLLASADVVLQPSRLDCFGIVLLEAWMCGKPVIGSWTGAMPDLIEDGINGFLVPWGDTCTLAHRLDLLLTNCDMRHEMGMNGRDMVLSNWTWDRITHRFYRRLEECEAAPV